MGINTVAMTKYPKRYPNTICIYENPVFAPALPTNPGIEMKVTPLKLAPIMPMATKIQGELLSAVKNWVLVSSPLAVNRDTKNRTIK